MSHFSKIKTNITDLSILCKAVDQLGFRYEILRDSANDSMIEKNLLLYDTSDNLITTFAWNGFEYNIIVDLQLWHLNIDFNYFVERLSQQYAYNVIMGQSYSNGFQKVHEHVKSDGSIKITLKKWS